MSEQNVATEPSEDAAWEPPIPLSEHWLRDQSLAFAATLLGELDFFFPRAHACVTLLNKNIACIQNGLVSDTTLSLISSIHSVYLCEDDLMRHGLRDLAQEAAMLMQVVSVAREQLSARDNLSADSLDRVLLSHLVSLLIQPHITAVQFLKWIDLVMPKTVPGVTAVVEKLRININLCQQLNAALAASKNPDMHTCDRAEQIDHLYATVLSVVYKKCDVVIPWWTRICMAYRSSLFCWPLLTLNHVAGKPMGTETTNNDPSEIGFSLPISLFLIEGQPDIRPIWNPNDQIIEFNYQLSYTEQQCTPPLFLEDPKGQQSHIDGFHFAFTSEWAFAFAVGMTVAKKLWSNQNGRLRSVDWPSAQRKLASHLHVDLRAACDIVESVYAYIPKNELHTALGDDAFFVVADRSAEAYWTQCVLGLLLPTRRTPLALCTGTIKDIRGAFQMGNVAGIVHKIAYANRAGVPRVIVPGVRHNQYGEDADQMDESRAYVQAFSRQIYSKGIQPSTVVNRTPAARAAADAMQSSGWRRLNFIRTADFQYIFEETQKRLHIHDVLKNSARRLPLGRLEIAWHNKHGVWTDAETEQCQSLDQLILTCTDQPICYIRRDQIDDIEEDTSVAQRLGKWAAWKDYQRWTGEQGDRRRPGLGILALRTAEGDDDIRLWAALAETLDASACWWETFRHADLPQVADSLARLLCNYRGDPEICLGSAPDILIIFDDAGLTQRRSDSLFPEELCHSFFNLLNSSHPDNRNPDFLGESLKDHDVGKERGFSTRIIVVVDTPVKIVTEDAILTPMQRDILSRLSIFRFGFSQQIGFALVNSDLKLNPGGYWKIFNRTISELSELGLIVGGRKYMQLTQKARQILKEYALPWNNQWSLALAHRSVALILYPILHPQELRRSVGRDAQWGTENILEASWHLEQAYSLVPWRFRNRWEEGALPSPAILRVRLALLCALPDWDTVRILHTRDKTRADSVELSNALLEMQRTRSGKEPSSIAIGLMIETMGHVFKFPRRQGTVESDINTIVSLANVATKNLKEDRALTDKQRHRRLLHVMSQKLFALRMLGLPFDNPVLIDEKLYIDAVIPKIMRVSFLSQIGSRQMDIDDFPICRPCWQALWSDGHNDVSPNKTLALAERSTYAYAAARATLGRKRAGHTPAAPWDEPWIAYFTLTRPEDIEPNQFARALNTWSYAYDKRQHASFRFGQSVLNMQSHAQPIRKNNKIIDWKEGWSRDIVQSSRNLWNYVTHPDPKNRVTGASVAPALRLIRVLALRETLTTFDFLDTCGRDWLGHWPQLIVEESSERWPNPATGCFGFVAKEWTSLGSSIVGQMAAWVAMLADIKALPDDGARLQRILNWLTALEKAFYIGEIKSDLPFHVDPENLLLKRATKMPLVRKYKTALEIAKGATDRILSQEYKQMWMGYGHRRQQLIQIRSALNHKK